MSAATRAAFCVVLALCASLSLSQPTVRLRFTARHFISAGCMQPNEIDAYWFGDANARTKNPRWIDDIARCPIRNDILDGVYSGHPDFEAGPQVAGSGCSGTPLSLSQDPRIPNFTLAKGGDSCSFLDPISWNAQYPQNMTRIIESILEPHTDGIPKPIYCQGGPYKRTNDTRCGWVFNTQTKTFQVATTGITMFRRWYRDDARFSKRVSYDLELSETPSNSRLYSFFSDSFHPLNQFPSCTSSPQQRLDCSNGGKIWPRAVKGSSTQPLDERTDPRGAYSFTTETHTFFTFQGNETLEFRGDDDVWIFINERLALDVGGLHPAARSVVNLSNPDVQVSLGLSKIGMAYSLDIFHAERRTTGSSFGLTTSLVPGCTVRDSASSVFDLDVTPYSELSLVWKTLGSAFIPAGKQLRLIQSGQTNLAGYAFLRQRVNMVPGFTVGFQFSIGTFTDPSFDGGFALLIHRSPLSLNDMNGGTGPNLGFASYAMTNSLAVSLNFTQEIPLLGVAVNGRLAVSAALTHPNDILDGAAHRLDLWYYGSNPSWLEVYLDGDLFLQHRYLGPLTDVLGSSTSAWVGFTAASGSTAAPEVNIWNVSVKAVTVNDEQTILGKSILTAKADGRDFAGIEVITNDFCGNRVTFGGLSSRIAIEFELVNILSRHLVNSSWTGTTDIQDNEDGTYLIKIFSGDFVGTLRPKIKFGSFSMPFPELITFVVPDLPTSSPTASIGGASPFDTVRYVGIAFGVIITIAAAAVLSGVYARWRWRTNKKFITPGKETLAEKGVVYRGCEDLTELQRKVQLSYEALRIEKTRQIELLDDDIESLSEQVQQIQTEIRRMKESKQQRSALRPGSGQSSPRLPSSLSSKASRKEFSAVALV